MLTNDEVMALLNDPVAQELLHAPIPARLAYVGKDGTPRVIPIGFYWTGEEIVVAVSDFAPNRDSFNNVKVALTIDTNTFPFKVLKIRGTARATIMDSVPVEYIKAGEQLLGPEGAQAFMQTLQPLLPNIKHWIRVAIKPEWASILDFQTRFPSQIVKAMTAAPA